MRSLTVPCAILLTVAVAVACESRPVTAPSDEVSVPELNMTAVAGCPAGFQLTQEVKGVDIAVIADIDRNEDTYVCAKETPGGRVVVIDNNLTIGEEGCPAGTELFIPLQINHPADVNEDGRICANASGTIFTDNVI